MVVVLLAFTLLSAPTPTRREGGIDVDWIDREKALRSSGGHTLLLPSEHDAVNARYPGTTLEYCWECGHSTGHAGKGDDSLYDEDGGGPYCSECWREAFPVEV